MVWPHWAPGMRGTLPSEGDFPRDKDGAIIRASATASGDRRGDLSEVGRRGCGIRQRELGMVAHVVQVAAKLQRAPFPQSEVALRAHIPALQGLSAAAAVP